MEAFDGMLGVSLSVAGIRVQATHVFVRNKLGLGIGFNYLNFNFNFTYHYHEILGGESQARVQLLYEMDCFNMVFNI